MKEEIKNGMMTLGVSVPVNTTASGNLPHALVANVKESRLRLMETIGVNHTRQMNENVLLNAEAGKYIFEYPFNED